MSSERDPALEKAWRAQSREEPPRAIDQAILAAAHRAVASGPQEIGREAVRPPRWWMPLAAAAVVGVVAVGVIQLAPPEPPALDMVASAPAPMQQKRVEESLATPAAPAAKESANVLQEGTQEQAQKKQKVGTDKFTDAAPPPPAKVLAQKAAPPPPAVAAPPPMPMPLESRENKRDATRPEPFPGSTAGSKTEATDDKRAAVGPRDRGGFVADAARPGAQPATPPAPAADEPRARKDVMAERQMAAAPPPPASAPVPAPARQAAVASEKDAAAAPALPPVALRREAERSQVEGKLGAAAGVSQLAKNAEPTEEARMKARDPDAWIARIRKLRDDGNTAEAQRELREFRALVPDAERRLPADLRDWKP